ncbi:MAG: hypothetical protein LBU26_04885, partial [Synergistaceae bacterium]|nr:hypothetical protein [Synergistaceae bacterium]
LRTENIISALPWAALMSSVFRIMHIGRYVTAANPKSKIEITIKETSSSARLKAIRLREKLRFIKITRNNTPHPFDMPPRGGYSTVYVPAAFWGIGKYCPAA